MSNITIDDVLDFIYLHRDNIPYMNHINKESFKFTSKYRIYKSQFLENEENEVDENPFI